MPTAPETLTQVQTNALAYSYLIASEQLTEFWEWCQADDRREAIKIARAILNETESQGKHRKGPADCVPPGVEDRPSY